MDKKSQAYTNIVKGDVLHHSKSDQILARIKPDVSPNYEDWDVRGLIFSMKQINIEDARALEVISRCTDVVADEDKKELLSSVIHLKNRCPNIQAHHISKMYSIVLETLKVKSELLFAFRLKSDTLNRLEIYNYRANFHMLCNH
jgi:hypothetical protein